MVTHFLLIGVPRARVYVSIWKTCHQVSEVAEMAAGNLNIGIRQGPIGVFLYHIIPVIRVTGKIKNVILYQPLITFPSVTDF